MPVEEAVRKCTSLPATRLRLPDRGRIATGMKADLVLLDGESFLDTATFDDPHRFPEGVKHVFVNGEESVSGDTNLSARAGNVIRKG